MQRQGLQGKRQVRDPGGQVNGTGIINRIKSKLQGVAMNYFKWKLAALLMTLGMCMSGQALAVDKALIIGVEHYALSSINLKGIDLDVKMARDMALYMGILPENIHVLMDDQATLSGVRDQMKNWLGQGVASTDRVFFYYSGHGTQVPDKNNEEADGLDEAMVLYDVDGKSYKGLYIDDDFGKDLKSIPSQNMVVMVDACHSGTGTRNISFEGGNSFNVKEGMPKFVNLFNLKPGVHKDVSGGQLADGAEENYLAIAAAQDNQQSIATQKGSLFTVAFRSAFESERDKATPATLRSIYLATEAMLKQSNVKFQPNMNGRKAIADTPLKVNNNGGESNVQNGPLWQELSNLADKLPTLQISAPASRVKGEATEFQVLIPSEGYLNIVMIGPRDNSTVLFPNSYHTDNHVSAGKLNFPTSQMPFKITAQPPYGKTLVVAIVTREKVNLMEEGVGHRDARGKSIKPFAQLTRSGMKALNSGTRDLVVTAKDEATCWGGKAEINILEK